MLRFSKVNFSSRISLKIHMLNHLFLVLLWCPEISSGLSKLKIIRSIDGKVDRIRFPKQLCGNISAEDIGCDKMQKRKGQSCSCTCNKTNITGPTFVRSTFGYYNGSWQCSDNLQVRRHAGCSFLLTGESITDPLRDISLQSYVIINIPEQLRRCRINPLKSAYLKCDGNWKLLRETVLRRYVKTSKRFTRNPVIIEYLRTTKVHPFINGRVIKLAVQCRKQKTTSDSGCIVMKVKGKLKCPYILKLATTKPTMTTKNVTSKPGSPSKKVETPRIEAIKSNIKKRKRMDEPFTSSMAVIAGAVAVVLLALVVVLIIVVMVMRRKEISSEDHDEYTSETEHSCSSLSFE